MPTIHPTAIIDRRAEIAGDVEIGPYCIIEGPVVMGPGCRLQGHVHLTGPLVLGEGNSLYPFVCLGLEPQDRKYDRRRPGPGVVIGKENIFRESATVHRATDDQPTRIGDRNFFMGNSHVGHDSIVGNDCTLANGALVAGHVELHDNVTMGGGSAIHQFCRVGRLSMVSGAIAMTQDLPPFCTAYTMRAVGSLNLVGLRRAGLREHIRPLHQAFNILFRRGYARQRALEAIEQEVGHDPLCREFAAFVRASKRGITAYGGSCDAEAKDEQAV